MREDAPSCGFYDYSSETSFHGLGYIRKDKPFFSQCFWFLAFSGCAALTGYLIWDGLVTFMNQPTATSYDFVTNHELKLPTVVLCTFNRLKKSKMIEMGLSEDLQKVLHRGFHEIPVASLPERTENLTPEMLTRTKEEYRLLTQRLGVKDFAEFVDLITDNCTDIVETCIDSMRGKRYNCCEGSKKLISKYGPCFAIETPIQRMPMLGMQIFARLPETKDKTKQWLGNYPNNALQFSLSSNYNSTSSPKLSMKFAAAGTHTQVLMHARKIRIEENNQGDSQMCRADATSDTYSKENCLLNCWTAGFRKKCRCQKIDVVTGLEEEDLPTCTPWDIADCSMPFNIEAVKDCSKTCLPACKQTIYDTEISTAPFDSIMMSYWREHSVEVPLMLHSRALIEIMFRDMQSVNIRQYWAATPQVIIGQIGGQVGLWIGGSILTLIHVLVYICECGCNGGQRKTNYEKPPRKASTVPETWNPGNSPTKKNQPYPTQSWNQPSANPPPQGAPSYPMSHYPPSMASMR